MSKQTRRAWVRTCVVVFSAVVAVLAAVTGAPLPGALEGHVYGHGSPKASQPVRLFRDGLPLHSTTTDEDGYYEFEGLAPGPYTVAVTAIPPEEWDDPAPRAATVLAGATITVDFQLVEPRQAAPGGVYLCLPWIAGVGDLRCVPFSGPEVCGHQGLILADPDSRLQSVDRVQVTDSDGGGCLVLDDSSGWWSDTTTTGFPGLPAGTPVRGHDFWTPACKNGPVEIQVWYSYSTEGGGSAQATTTLNAEVRNAILEVDDPSPLRWDPTDPDGSKGRTRTTVSLRLRAIRQQNWAIQWEVYPLHHQPFAHDQAVHSQTRSVSSGTNWDEPVEFTFVWDGRLNGQPLPRGLYPFQADNISSEAGGHYLKLQPLHPAVDELGEPAPQVKYLGSDVRAGTTNFAVNYSFATFETCCQAPLTRATAGKVVVYDPDFATQQFAIESLTDLEGNPADGLAMGPRHWLKVKVPSAFTNRPGQYAFEIRLFDGAAECHHTDRSAYYLEVGQYWHQPVDLDVDSDNDNGTDPPGRTLAEEATEEDVPGKVADANRQDLDEDEVPDFADGYDLDGDAGSDDDASAEVRFYPLVLELPAHVDLDAPSVGLYYHASDPASVTREAGVYTAAPGKLRLWRKNGDQPRDQRNVTAGGDYLPPGDEYTPRQLGFDEETWQVTYYVEGVHPSKSTLIRATFEAEDGVVAEDLVRLLVVYPGLEFVVLPEVDWGEIDTNADYRQAGAVAWAYLQDAGSEADWEPVDGGQVRWQLRAQGEPPETVDLDADGTSLRTCQTTRQAGQQDYQWQGELVEYQVDGESFECDWVAESAVFHVAPGAPVTPEVVAQPYVAGGVAHQTLTAQVTDQHGNKVPDGTPFGWQAVSSTTPLLNASTATQNGQAAVTLTAPAGNDDQTIACAAGSGTRYVSPVLQRVEGTWSVGQLEEEGWQWGIVDGAVVDVSQSPRLKFRVENLNAVDGTPVYWLSNNGRFETASSAVQGGLVAAELEVRSSGYAGQVYVTCLIGGTRWTWSGTLTSSSHLFVGAAHPVLTWFGGTIANGTESVDFASTVNGVAPEDFAPGMRPFVRDLDYYVETPLTVRGTPGATVMVQVVSPVDLNLVETDGTLHPRTRGALLPVILDASGLATLRVQALEAPEQPCEYIQVRVQPALLGLMAGELAAGDEPPSGHAMRIAVTQSRYWWPLHNFTRGLVGLNCKGVPGLIGSCAGGVLIVGDIGALIDNGWRWCVGAEVDQIEVVFAGLGLAMEIFKPLDLLSNVCRCTVAIAGQPGTSRAVTRHMIKAAAGGGDEALGRFGSWVKAKPGRGRVLVRVVGGDDHQALLDWLAEEYDEALEALGEALEGVSIEEGARLVNLLAWLWNGGQGGAQIGYVLDGLIDSGRAVELFGKAITILGTVDAPVIGGVLTNQGLYDSAYNLTHCIDDVCVCVEGAVEGLPKVLNRLAKAGIPAAQKGFRFELQVAAACRRAGSTVRILDLYVPASTLGPTDIDVVVEAVVGGTTKLLQCKYGPSHWRSVEHAKRWATEWATKTRGAVAGERWVVVPDVIELDAELVRGVAKCGVRGVAKVSDLSNVLAP